MSRSWGSYIVRTLDLAAAIVLIAILDGFNFDSSDDLSFVPWVYQWSDPSLYRNDLRFGEWPNPYYTFHLGYMLVLAKIMPIEWGLVLSSIVARLLLLVAMQRLAERISGKTVPALLFAILMTGYLNNHLVGGYYLVSPYFSTHYVAIAFILLAVAWFMEQRLWLAWGALLLAAPINPRMGLIGLATLALIWFWPRRHPMSRSLRRSGWLPGYTLHISRQGKWTCRP